MKLVSNLGVFADRIKQQAAEARHEAAQEIGAAAQANAPVRSGELRDSMRVEDDKDSSTVGFTAEYSNYVNSGTSRQAANPFFTAAFIQGKEVFKSKLEEKLKDVK